MGLIPFVRFWGISVRPVEMDMDIDLSVSGQRVVEFMTPRSRGQCAESLRFLVVTDLLGLFQHAMPVRSKTLTFVRPAAIPVHDIPPVVRFGDGDEISHSEGRPGGDLMVTYSRTPSPVGRMRCFA